MRTRIFIPRRSITPIIVFILILTVSIAGYIYLPQAVITIQPAISLKDAQQDILLSVHTQEPDFVRYILPARIIEHEAYEVITITRETESLSATDDFARGEIKLINKQDEEQRLLPKTNVRHEETGVFFLTDAPVTIPAEGDVMVSVTAKEAGARGNVSSGRFVVDKLSSGMQKVVYGESTYDFSGGQVVSAPLTDQDIESAKQDAFEKARNQVIGKLTAEVNGAAIREELITIDTISDSVSVKSGSRAVSFTADARVRARGFIVDTNDLLSLTLLALRSQRMPDEEFVSYKPDSFLISITQANFEQGEARVTGTLSGVFAQKISPSALEIYNLAGLNEQEITEHFKKFESVGEVQTTLSPFWVDSVPSRQGSTEIVIEYAP